MRRSSISGTTRIFGLLGHPVQHSLSPVIYNTLFEQFGIDAVYLALNVPPNESDRIAQMVRTMGLAGVNLTVPHKESVLTALDSASPAVHTIKAANVVTQNDGLLVGHNTDGEGFVRSLAEERGPNLKGLRAVILGAGGAARAVASGLLEHGAEHIVFLNRSTGRAHQTQTILANGYPNAVITTASLDSTAFSNVAADAQLVVNCTSGGAVHTVQDFDPAVLPSDAHWVDINYWMTHPPCESKVKDSNRVFHNGLGMLAHQAALAFELFAGQRTTGQAVREILQGTA